MAAPEDEAQLRDREIRLNSIPPDSSRRPCNEAVEATVVNPTTDDENPGALVELRRLIKSEVTTSQAYVQAMTGIKEELASQLPPECRHILGDDEAGQMEILARLTAEGSEDVLARIEERVMGEA